MKLVLKNTEAFVNDKFNVSCREEPCLDASWHYHKQYELIYTSKSYGIRFVGDNVAQFFPGDLVLVGAFLPHLWRNDPSYYQEDSEKNVKTVVLKFTLDFLGEGTFENPAFSKIKNLLKESTFGLCFGKEVSESLHEELMELIDLNPADKLIKTLSLLSKLSGTEDKVLLSSTDMRQYATEPSLRIDAVIKYISDNYSGPISLDDVASIACMTTNSFCRFFKKMTNKSFTEFLNEVRIRNASRLLLQEDYTMSEVCYKAGYNSITNFYRQFKKIMGTTPKDYRQRI